MLKKQEKRHRRHKKIRSKALGTSERPRLCVFRSNQHISAQIINDEENKVIAYADDRKVKSLPQKSKEKTTLGDKALKSFKVGEMIAEMAIGKKIKKVVFDRGGYKYHGRVKSLAKGARKGGLEF